MSRKFKTFQLNRVLRRRLRRDMLHRTIWRSLPLLSTIARWIYQENILILLNKMSKYLENNFTRIGKKHKKWMRLELVYYIWTRVSSVVEFFLGALFANMFLKWPFSDNQKTHLVLSDLINKLKYCLNDVFHWTVFWLSLYFAWYL